MCLLKQKAMPNNNNDVAELLRYPARHDSKLKDSDGNESSSSYYSTTVL